MKKILFLLLISTVVSFGRTKKVPSRLTPKTHIKKLKNMICFGWKKIYNDAGEEIGKHSDNCWNASQGNHNITILYQY
jgi:hypothetical protein